MIVGVFWVLAMQFEVSERVAIWLQSYEKFQLDEVPLTLLVLSLSLAWFALRRFTEASALLASNRDLTQRLMTAQEDERRILAQELHDEVGQACTALRIEAAYIAKSAHSQPDAAVAAAQRIDQSTLRMHGLARDMLTRLRPPNLDSLGLQASLRELCQNWQQHCHIECHALIDDQMTKVQDSVATCLYRVTQEALTNVAKHSKATQVWVRINSDDNVVTLSIKDNGMGITQLPSSSQGLGLIGMRERVASLQGHIHFENAQPGFCIQVQMPLQELAS
jgi:signal transduction histidine kinase